MPNVITAAPLPATPDRLYDMYLDPAQHEAFTGGKVTIAAKAGAPFSAFDGVLTGVILHVEPKRLIVQTWRSKNWPGGAIDGVLILTFLPEPEGARVELVHVNVPEVDFAGVSHGWQEFYWNPWRTYLETHAA